MSGFDHTAAHLAARTQLLTLSVVTTGSASLSATATGYARAAGSFVTDGFAVGMEVTASGFGTSANNGTGRVTAVTATALSVSAYDVSAATGAVTSRTLAVESAGAGRTIAVSLPAVRGWENVALTPTQLVPYITEEYVPGPTEQVSLGPLGEMEALPLYLPKIYVPSNIGRAAASKYADALLNHFAPRTSLSMTGATLTVRTNPGPFPGQMLQLESGWAVVPVTIPLRYRVACAT